VCGGGGDATSGSGGSGDVLSDEKSSVVEEAQGDMRDRGVDLPRGVRFSERLAEKRRAQTAAANNMREATGARLGADSLRSADPTVSADPVAPAVRSHDDLARDAKTHTPYPCRPEWLRSEQQQDESMRSWREKNDAASPATKSSSQQATSLSSLSSKQRKRARRAARVQLRELMSSELRGDRLHPDRYAKCYNISIDIPAVPAARRDSDDYRISTLHAKLRDTLRSNDRDDDAPKGYKRAEKSEKWRAAIAAELAAHVKSGSIAEMSAAELREMRMSGARPLRTVWVFKNKYDTSGKFEKAKARMCVDGSAQPDDMDVSVPTPKDSDVRALIAETVRRGATLHKVDVKNAYLHATLPAPYYLRLQDGRVVKMLKSIYGLREAGLLWRRLLVRALVSAGYSATAYSPCTFVRGSSIAIVHVDDILLSGEKTLDPALVKCLEPFGFTHEARPSSYVGYHLRYLADGSIHISQPAYIRDITHGVHVPATTLLSPYASTNRLRPRQAGEAAADSNLLRTIVGRLIFAAEKSRPDIAYAVRSVARYVADPSASHLAAALQILKYLKATEDYGLLYRAVLSKGEPFACAYSDADWGAAPDGRPTAATALLLAGAAVHFSSERQASVALSSAEAEMIALSNCARYTAALRNVLHDWGTTLPTITVKCDNQSTIRSAQVHDATGRMRHVGIRDRYVFEALQQGLVRVAYVPTKQQAADIFTKPLAKQQFVTCRKLLGITPAPIS
jgi:hypothetical protein